MIWKPTVSGFNKMKLNTIYLLTSSESKSEGCHSLLSPGYFPWTGIAIMACTLSNLFTSCMESYLYTASESSDLYVAIKSWSWYVRWKPICTCSENQYQIGFVYWMGAEKIKTFSWTTAETQQDRWACFKGDGGKITRHWKSDGLRFIRNNICLPVVTLLQLLITVDFFQKARVSSSLEL